MIVGIGHIKQVGKSTAAQALCAQLGFHEISFAGPLKELAYKMDPLVQSGVPTNIGAGRGRLQWVINSLGWDRAKEQMPEVRRLLQNLGVAARETFGEDFWIDMAFRVDRVENVVISDVRFQNEFNAIKDRGGMLIKIIRPGREAAGHISETELLSVPDDEWDCIIENRGTVLELEAAVVDAVQKFKVK